MIAFAVWQEAPVYRDDAGRLWIETGTGEARPLTEPEVEEFSADCDPLRGVLATEGDRG